ncbi:MAG: sulfatase [Bacteroidota bacterium]
MPRLLSIFLVGLLVSTTAINAQNQPRPNVLLIFTDDQGSLDMNCYGSDDLQTPHMDALAASGVRFTQFYSAAPVCSPSRAGLLTGRTPLRAGLPGNVPIPYHREGAGLPTEEVTVAEMLKEGGYKTGHVGKWHLGHIPEKQPTGQGFDYSFGHMVGCIDNYSHFFYWSGPNQHDLWRNGEEVYYPGQFFPDLMVEEANRFLEQNQDTTFFLYWAINVPHYPYQGTPEWLETYSDLPSPRREYAAFLSTMDDKIGRVLNKLDELGLRENTLVIFQSDHGHSVEERAFFGGGNAGEYRGAKFSLFEGGIRVPAIVSWPGTLPEGEVRDQLAVGTDWLPTVADLCGVSQPQTVLDGKSLAPLIRDGSVASPHSVVYWQTGQGENSQWAVRQGDWKLIGRPRDPVQPDRLVLADSLFLSNLKQDISESTNLAGEHPERVQELHELYQQWQDEIMRENQLRNYGQ